MPYREICVHGKRVVNTLLGHLPQQATLTMREKLGGVDNSNFYNWSKLFVEHVRPLTAGGRKVLLTYDGY